MIDYQKKYLKYKAKYLELKKQIGGGDCKSSTYRTTMNKKYSYCKCTEKDKQNKCIKWKEIKV